VRRKVVIHYSECLKLLRWPVFSAEKNDPMMIGIPEIMSDNQPNMESNEIVDRAGAATVPVATVVGVSVNVVAAVGTTVVSKSVDGTAVVGGAVVGGAVVGATEIGRAVDGAAVVGAAVVGGAVVGAMVVV